MVSDLFILFRTFWYLEAAPVPLLIRCLLVEAGGVGSLVEAVKDEGSRVCEAVGM